MNVIDLITFVVVMLLLGFLFLRRVIEEKRRREHPELYEEEKAKEQEALKELMKSLNIKYAEDDEEPESLQPLPPPQPPPPSIKLKPQIKKSIIPELEKHTLRKGFLEPFKDPHSLRGIKLGNLKEIQKDAYKITERENSRALDIIKKLDSPQEMIIIKEILDTPLALTQMGLGNERR